MLAEVLALAYVLTVEPEPPPPCTIYALTEPCAGADHPYVRFLTEAAPVIECESGGNELAVGAAGERGLLQLHPVHQIRVEQLGYTWDQMFERYPNLHVAYTIWLRQSWWPWAYCGRNK